MEIDKKMVEYVAELAKLRLNEEEKALMANDLSKVLMYMDVLNSLDTIMWSRLLMFSRWKMFSAKMWCSHHSTGMKF